MVRPAAMLVLYQLLAIAVILLPISADGAPYEFRRRPENRDQCYQPHNITILATEYTEGPNGELIQRNVTKVIQTKTCCEGYTKMGSQCVSDASNPVNPCGNLSCAAVPEAQCIIFKKCGKEVALFMHQGSIVSKCNEDVIVDPLSCSGVCVQDPCLAAECPAFDRSEVSCFISGCDCKPIWIHVKDRAEVNCQSGQAVSKHTQRRAAEC